MFVERFLYVDMIWGEGVFEECLGRPMMSSLKSLNA